MKWSELSSDTKNFFKFNSLTHLISFVKKLKNDQRSARIDNITVALSEATGLFALMMRFLLLYS